jgi:broad specificity phosphatase PhoE
MDVIQRLEPVIIEIERERECVVVVAHQAVLRALYGYFMKIPLAVRKAPVCSLLFPGNAHVLVTHCATYL